MVVVKLRFYFDLWPGIITANWLPMATTNPGEKCAGVKRFAFDVTIPDSLIHEVDVVLPEVSRVEPVVDHDAEPTP